jgi:hypothetical protein
MGTRTSATWVTHYYDALLESSLPGDIPYLRALAKGEWRPSEAKQRAIRIYESNIKKK